MGTAWARHGMCELAFTVPSPSSEMGTEVYAEGSEFGNTM
jgi:hypothetical protein